MENLAILIGHLGADPELSYTAQGTPVAKFSIATNEKWSKGGRGGEQKESTVWHQVEVWKKIGEACAKHLEKGSRVYVRGFLKTSSWEPAPGVRSNATVIKAKKVLFLDRK